jgi:hypothetical protein
MSRKLCIVCNIVHKISRIVARKRSPRSRRRRSCSSSRERKSVSGVCGVERITHTSDSRNIRITVKKDAIEKC